jgi:hypothetical protein
MANAEPAPVLFLDCDGVLNAHDYPWDERRGPQHLRQAMCERLERVLRETGAVIVLSTAWRYRVDLDTIEAWLRSQGAPSARVVGRTPMGGEMGYTLGPIPGHGEARMWIGEHRGREIRAWLDANNVERFAIAEDSADLGDLEPWCVRTQPDTGLEDQHTDALIAMLGGAR